MKKLIVAGTALMAASLGVMGIGTDKTYQGIEAPTHVRFEQAAGTLAENGSLTSGLAESFEGGLLIGISAGALILESVVILDAIHEDR